MPELKKQKSQNHLIPEKKRSNSILQRITDLRQRIYRRTGKILSTAALLGLLMHPSFAKSAETKVFRDPQKIELMQQYSYSNMDGALKKAIEDFKTYIYQRSERSHSEQILFGPNLDDAYQYRVGERNYWNYSDLGIDVWGDVDPNKKRDFLAKGLPDLELFPKELINLIKLLNVFQRLNYGVRSDKIYVVKHFPGADGVEITEEESHFVKGSLRFAKDTFMKPFELLFQKSRPKAVMISHSKFEFEQELKEKYPELKQYYVVDDYLPASLSPAIIRGLLRKEFGFKGIIFSDWYNMGAIDHFLAMLPTKRYSSGTRLFYFAILAGVNVFKGSFPEEHQVEELYKKDPLFRAALDNIVKENLILFAKYLPQSVHYRASFADLEVTDLQIPEKEFPNKLKSLRDDLNAVFAKLTLKDKLEYVLDIHGKDIWNRHGILTMIFIQKFIENLTGKSFGQVPKDIRYEKAWLRRLFNDSEFVHYFKSIDWNNPTLKSMLSSYLEKL